MSFSDITLSENITSALVAAFFTSLKICIFFLLVFTQSKINFFGSYFFGQPIDSLNENLTEAAIKLFNTLLQSPIQAILSLDINFELKYKYGIFLQDCFNYKFNLFNKYESPWEGTRVAKKKNLKTINFLRQKIKSKN